MIRSRAVVLAALLLVLLSPLALLIAVFMLVTTGRPVLYRGELPRADTAGIVGTGERQARRVVSALLERGVLTSESTRAPLRLAFPAALASRWMPGLFPERTDEGR